jgi:hypothetical protein
MVSAGRPLGARAIQSTGRRMMPTDFTIQLIERIEDSLEYLVTAGCETVDPRRLGALRLGRTKPATRRHPCQHRIQRPWTQVIAVVAQFFQHPVTIDALFSGMVENVDLPEGEEELADDRIAHNGFMISLQIP